MGVEAFNQFSDSESLAKSLANRIAQILADAVEARGEASLAVSGGTTPRRLFVHLSRLDIDWSKVWITLVDDRCVPPDHERSNALLVRRHLLIDRALNARFQPLTIQGCGVSLPFDCVVLGMGNDGHTASFFPNGNHLSEATDPQTSDIVVSMEAPGAGEPRITLTLPVLVSARSLVLHIEGTQKRNVLEEAGKDGDADTLPIRHVLRHPDAAIDVYWAP